MLNNKIIYAFNHVKSLFPKTSMVVFTCNGCGYFDEDFNPINFGNAKIEKQVLLDAWESLESFPFAYHPK